MSSANVLQNFGKQEFCKIFAQNVNDRSITYLMLQSKNGRGIFK